MAEHKHSSSILRPPDNLHFCLHCSSEKLSTGALLGGLAGAAIAEAATKKPIEKELYVIDMQRGKLFWVDSAFMMQSLEALPALRDEFNKETDKENGEVQLKYINKLNQIYN